MKDRNSGLDIFRILCCIGVLNYHVFDDGFGGVFTYLIYYGSSFCIPGFFLLSGYLMAAKERISLEYCENKVKSMLMKLLGWVIFWSAIHFIRTGELYDIWNEFFKGILSDGILPASWFLFSYCILTILAYSLSLIRKKSRKMFDIAVIIWMFLIVMGFGDDSINRKPQALWLHLYVGYYGLGMVIQDYSDCFHRKLNSKPTMLLSSAIFIGMSAIYAYNIRVNGGLPERHYSCWYYMLWLISLIAIIMQIDLHNSRIKAFIKIISEDTFAVYLGHLPMLLYITALRPLHNFMEALMCVIGLFLVLTLMAEVFKKIPILRKIV